MKKLSRQLLSLTSVVLLLVLLFAWRNHRPQQGAATSHQTPAPVTEQPAQLLPPVAPVAAAPPAPASPLVASPKAEVTPSRISAFQSWADAYVGAIPGARTALLAEGEELAKARRTEMLQLIKSDPEKALHLAVSYGLREQLPGRITTLLEEPVSGRGDFSLICYTPLPGREREVPPDFWQVVLNHKTYEAFVYGRRLHQSSHSGLSMHGIAIDRYLALSPDPVRLLDPAEAARLLAEKPATAGAPCAVCGEKPAPGAQPVLAELGAKIIHFCDASHAVTLNQQLAEAELKLPPRASMPAPSFVLPPSSPKALVVQNPAPASTSPSPNATLGPYPVTNLPPAGRSGTQGEKRLILMPVLYADDPTPPQPIDGIYATAQGNSQYYEEGSYGTASFDTTVTPYLKLPETRRFYGDFLSYLMPDALAAATAMEFDVGAYQYRYVIFNPIEGITFGGRSDGLLVGGAGAITHELGHNFGLAHGNFWDTRGNAPLPQQPPPPVGPYPFEMGSLIGHDDINAPYPSHRDPPDVEYGDPFDVMGSGGGHFSTAMKYKMNWLPDQFTRLLTQSETNRVYAYDVPSITQGRLYALRMPKNAKRAYWASYRQGFPSNPWLSSGIELTGSPWDNTDSSAIILDTTPGTSPGRFDAAVVVGRTYADPQIPLYLTPIAKGGDVPTNKWIDVVVQFGPFPTNLPPTLAISADQTTVTNGATVTFTATATDPNGDALAYYWDFSDNTFGINSPINQKTFFNDGQYVVRCEVSDMKGGLSSAYVVVVVGNPTNLFTMSGRVIDLQGNPIQGARVHNSGTIPPFVATPEGAPPPPPPTNGTYRMALTDSQGYYTIGNIPAGTYTNRAFIYGYNTMPSAFFDPVVLNNANATGLDHLASPLPLVSVTVFSNAFEGPTPKLGALSVSRTGSTNNDLVVNCALSGTAVSGVDYVPLGSIVTNTVTQTNGGVVTNITTVTTNALTNVVIFAGNYATNLLITPINNTNGTGPKTVVMTLALQQNDTRISCYLTNIVSTITNTSGGSNVVTTITNSVFICVTNAVTIPGWELLPTGPSNGLAWFQTYPTYVLGIAEQAVTIFDDDPPDKPTVVVFTLDSDAIEVVNDSASVAFLRIGGSSESNLVVNYTLSGTASNGIDYQKLSGSITIPAGQRSAILPIVGIHDLFVEGNQTVDVTISANAAYNVGTPIAEVLLVNDNLPLVSAFSTSSTAIKGGNNGSVTFARQGDLSMDLLVNYLVTGTALSGVDYQVLSGSIIIPAGQMSVSFPIVPINSANPGPMTVTVLVSASTTYNISALNNKVTVTIVDQLPVVTLAVTTATIAEGGAPAGAVFTVTRTGSTNSTNTSLVVNFDVGGSAVEGADYAPIGRTVTIPAGATTATIVVVPNNDPFNEFGDLQGDDKVIVQLEPGPGYNVGNPSSGTVSITNDDASDLPAIGFLLGQSSGREDPPGAAAVLAVRISANPKTNQQPALVDYRITSGSAINGVNYIMTNGFGTLSFMHYTAPPAGPGPSATPEGSIQLLIIPLLNDHAVTGDRTFTVTLTNHVGYVTNFTTNNSIISTNIVADPTNCYVGEYRSHTFTIIDVGTNVVGIQATTPLAFERGSVPGIFTVTRSGPTNNPLTIYFAVSGTASGGPDYVPLGNSVTIPAGTNTVLLPVVPNPNSTEEVPETVTVTLVDGPGFTIINRQATIIIVDGDGTVQFTAANYYANEGDGQALIGVQRTGPTNTLVTVSYVVSDGTATNGVDYRATNGVLTFPPGSALQFIPIQIIENFLVSPTKTVNLALTNSTGGVPLGGQNAATLFILNDNTGFAFGTNRFRVNENGTNALIPINRFGLTNATNLVTFWTSDGTATNNKDYHGLTNTITFLPGETNHTMVIPIIDNAVQDGNRTVNLTLTNAIAGAPFGGTNSALLTIVDDECALQFSSPTYSVEEYAGVVVLSVQRVGGTVNPVSVHYQTIDGTAIGNGTNNIDYVGQSGTLFFQGDRYLLATNGSGSGVTQYVPGDTNQTISIVINDNTIGTGDKTFTVLLSSPVGPLPPLALPNSAVLGTPTNAVVTILDNETPGNVDYEFNPGLGPNDRVLALALQADLRIVFGGDFTTVNNIVYNRIARLQANGNLDVSFNPGAGINGTVDALAIQPDKRILVGGFFTLVDTTPRPSLARLNLDGNIDLTFDPGTGPDKQIRAIAVQTNGQVLIGGDFTRFGSSGRFHLARLNTNGTLDATFAPVASDSVYALAVQPDGKILVGGNFTTLGASARAYVGRLNTNGTVDTTFNPGTGANGTVTSLALQPDGNIVLGGKFTVFNGTNLNYVARLTSTGSVDVAFSPGTGPNAAVSSVAVHPTSGKITLGGDFTLVNGASRSRFARLNPNGSLDSTFKVGTGANATVRAVAVQPDTAVLIGGEFTQVENLPRNYIARIHGEEKLDLTAVSFAVASSTVAENAGAATITVVRSGNTNRAFGISFTTSNGTAVASIDYTATNGLLSFASGDLTKTFTVPIIDNTRIDGNRTLYLYLSNPPPNVVLGVYPVTSLTILDDETGIAFASANYSVLENATNALISLIRLGSVTGAVSVTFSTTDGTAVAGLHYVGVTNAVGFADGQSNATVLVPIIDDGVRQGPLTVNLALSVPVGTQLGLSNAILTIIDTDPGPGGVDPAFDPGVGADNFVRSLALQPDGRILAGGAFTVFANTNRNYIARLNTNGTLDLTFDPGLGADALVASVASLPDGRAVLGGAFTNLNGLAYNHVGRLLTNGAPDPDFLQTAGFDAAVSAVGLHASGRILAGGGFSLPSRDFIQLQPGGGIDFSFDPGVGANAPVLCVLVQTNGQVLLGGSFTSVNGSPRTRVARLNSNGAVDPSFVSTAVTNGSVYSLALQPDGKVILGGDFFTMGKTNAVGLARLNWDGSLDSSFDPGSGANAAVFAVAVQTSGKIIAAGNFTTLNNTNRNRFVRLHQDGSVDYAFDPGTGANSTVYSVLLLPGGNFLIGGDFTAVNGLPRNRVARIKSDDVDPQFTTPILVTPGGPVQLTLMTQAGHVYVLDSSPDLKVWTPVVTNTATGPTLILTDPNPSGGAERFYRARQF